MFIPDLTYFESNLVRGFLAYALWVQVFIGAYEKLDDSHVKLRRHLVHCIELETVLGTSFRDEIIELYEIKLASYNEWEKAYAVMRDFFKTHDTLRGEND